MLLKRLGPYQLKIGTWENASHRVEQEVPMSTLAGAAGAVFFGFVGLLWLCWPRRFQRYMLRAEKRTPWNPFLPWMRTEGHIHSLRAMGILSLAAALVIVAVLVFGER
jgi:hypothetical protein